MTAHRLVLAGQYGSPYSLKMRAVLRYRHIPFRWVLRDSKWDDLPEVPVRIIPVIVFPDADGRCDEGRGEAMVDSSPQIMRLERQYEGRSVVPGDPALAFIDGLIEDFADEWLTKAMYHYRWAYEPDIAKAGKLLPLSQDLQMDSAEAEGFYEFITTRQIGRRALVGSTSSNRPVIEGSYRRVLDILRRVFDERDFLLGDRPGRGDFALFGQLSQLVRLDPTPTAVAVDRAPKVINWVDRVDDLSWLSVPDSENGGWLPRATIWVRALNCCTRPDVPMPRSCSPTPPHSTAEPMRSYARSPVTSIAKPHSSTRESASPGSATTTTLSPQPTAPASTQSSPAPAAKPCSPERRITASAQ